MVSMGLFFRLPVCTQLSANDILIFSDSVKALFGDVAEMKRQLGLGGQKNIYSIVIQSLKEQVRLMQRCVGRVLVPLHIGWIASWAKYVITKRTANISLSGGSRKPLGDRFRAHPKSLCDLVCTLSRGLRALVVAGCGSLLWAASMCSAGQWPRAKRN